MAAASCNDDARSACVGPHRAARHILAGVRSAHGVLARTLDDRIRDRIRGEIATCGVALGLLVVEKPRRAQATTSALP
jgi:hypothetical protein